MLVRSRIMSVYLTRRIRLFQAYTNKPNKKLQINKQQWFSHLPVQRIKQWICRLGQNLNDSCIELRKIKNLIDCTPSQIIQSTIAQTTQIINLALHFHPASKISNTLYYLCRKSYIFRKQLCIFLQKNWLDQKAHFSSDMRQKIWIVLTDLFIFGVYLTQNQYINNLQAFISGTIQNTDNLRLEYGFDYILKYTVILTRGKILLQRNINRLFQIFYSYLKQILQHKLIKIQREMQEKQKLLQQIYVRLQQTNIQVKNMQQLFILSMRKYQMTRGQLISTITHILNSMHSTTSNSTQFNQLLNRIYQHFPTTTILPSNSNTQLRQLSTNNNIQDLQNQINTESTPLKKDYEAAILASIYENCKHYKKTNLFVKDTIYTQPFLKSNQYSHSTQQVKFIQQLPQSFIEDLRNCSSIQSSNRLAEQFLHEFNKHLNRGKIVSVIFKEMYDRNNIELIVRCLYGVYCIQKEEIDEFIKQQLELMGNRVIRYSSNRIGNNEYGKYSSLIIQLIKFQFINEKVYMQGLLEQIKCMNYGEQAPLTANQNQNQNNTKSGGSSKLTVIQVMNLMQRLGRQVYYKSLHTHILFNKIIKQAQNHIKTRIIGYDIDIINRFNGLVVFLQNITNPQQNNKICDIVSVAELQDNRKFDNIVQEFQKQIRNNFIDFNGFNGLLRVSHTLTNSITHENYILSYLYAELVYQVNSKKLDQQLKTVTKSNITHNLSIGNYQGAANWGRFFGQLHRYNICQQNQLITFLQNIVVIQFLKNCTQAAVKVICSTIQACSSYMKQTKKKSQISQTLTFLLELRKQLLILKGLSNSILQQQIADIMQFFHPAFSHIATVQECIELRIKFSESSNIQRLMDNYEYQYQQKVRQQSQRIKEKAINGFYCQQDHQKKLNYRQEHAKSPQKLRILHKIQEQNFQIQLSELETNSSIIEKQTTTIRGSLIMSQADETEKKEKKLTVIGRRKNGNKNLQKRQIRLI